MAEMLDLVWDLLQPLPAGFPHVKGRKSVHPAVRSVKIENKAHIHHMKGFNKAEVRVGGLSPVESKNIQRKCNTVSEDFYPEYSFKIPKNIDTQSCDFSVSQWIEMTLVL